MIFRFRYQVLGGHTHVRVFAGKQETLGKCGDLVFRNEEWEAFMDSCQFEFVPELSDEQRMTAIEKAIEGKNNLVWAAMQYECKSCQFLEWIYMGIGVEGPSEMREEGLFIPAPYGTICPQCRSMDFVHVRWSEDKRFQPMQPKPGTRYFCIPSTGINRKHYGTVAFAGDLITA